MLLRPPGINNEAPLKTDLLLIYIFQVLCVSTPMVKNEAEIFECAKMTKKYQKYFGVEKIICGTLNNFPLGKFSGTRNFALRTAKSIFTPPGINNEAPLKTI